MLFTSHLDLELAAPVLTGAIRRLLDANFPCSPGPLVSDLYLDHVEIGTPTLGRSAPFPLSFDFGFAVADVPGYGVDVNIPVTLVFATEAAIRAGGLDGPTPVQTLGLTATFRLLGDATQGTGMQLTYIGSTAVTPLPNAQTQQTVMSILNVLFITQNQFMALPLGGLQGLLGTIPQARNVAVATDVGGTRIVVRVEFDAPAALTVIPWEAFLNSPPDRLGQNAWALVLSPGLMEHGIETRLDQEFISSSEVDIDEPTDADWVGWSPLPLLTLTASIELIDKCPLIQTLDIGADVVASVQISVENGQLVTGIHFEFDLIDSDVLLCGLVAGLFLAVAGAVFGPIGAIIGGAVGLIVSFNVVPVVAQLQDLDEDQIPQPPTCIVVDKGDRHFTLRCTQPLPVLNTLLGQLTATGVAGGVDGLQILGTSQGFPALAQELVLAPMPLAWAQKFNCSSKSMSTEVAGGVGLGAGVDVCPPVVLDDPLGFFLAQIVVDPVRRIAVTSNEDLRQAYTDAGSYSCHLLIQTNRGVRFVDLGPLGPPPPAPEPFVLEGLWLENCLHAFEKVWAEAFHPEWVIDPPPERARQLHWWRVAAQGFEPGDRLELYVEARQHVVAVSGVHGRAGVDAVVDPVEGQVSLRRGAAVRSALPEFSPERHRLALVQTLLVRSGSAPMPAAAFDVAALRSARGPLLVTASADGLRLWRPGGAIGPQLLWEAAADVGGIAAAGGMLISRGADGLRSWSATPHGTLQSMGRVAGQFSGLVASRGYVVATRRDGELQVFDLGRLQALSASHIPPGLLANARAAFARRSVVHGDTSTMRRSAAAERLAPTEERASFATDHWFTATVSVGRRRLARLERGGYRLDTYEVGNAVSI